MIYLFSNVGRSRLAEGAELDSTTLVLDEGTGSKFPSPGNNQGFWVRIGSSSLYDLRVCTARSGDTLTLSQPLAHSWAALTPVINPINAELVEALVQRVELEGWVAFGTGGNADRLLINGVATGPHLTGPQGVAGENGVDGDDGHSPVLTWSGDQIAIDGVASGPHLTGPAGATPNTTKLATWVIGSGSLSTPVNDIPVYFSDACTIKSVVILTQGGIGSCVVDVWKAAFASYPPTVANRICASAKPTISNGVSYSDSTLTGWTKAISACDVVMFHLESVSVFSFISIILTVQ